MIERVSLPDKTVVLVGTAHVSRESVDRVKQVIDEESPDQVCVELDQHRYDTLVNPEEWQDLDIPAALRQGRGYLLLANILLSIYQRSIGDTLDMRPGEEMVEAVQHSEEQNIGVSFIDRDVSDTLRNAVQALTFREKLRLFAAVTGALFQSPDITQDDVEALKERDMIEAAISDLGGEFPALKDHLLDRRDIYMAARIREQEGDTIVAVVGAAHVAGVAAQLREDAEPPTPMEPGRSIPIVPVLQYGVPLIIIGLFLHIFIVKGVAVAGNAFLVWFAANGMLAALGALLSLAHPATVVAAFFTAPFTSLNPVLPSGLVAAYVENWVRPPTVADLEGIGVATSYRALWSNGALKLVLIFFLVNLGSSIASYAAGGYLATLVL